MENNDKLLNQVIALNESEDYDKVIELLSEEVLKQNENAQLYAEAAQAFWRKDEYEESKIYAEKAIQLDTNNSKPYNYLGNAYWQLKEYKKAEEFYLKAIKIDENYVDPYNGLGNVYSDLKEFQKAEKYYLRAIKINKNYAYPYNNLGILYSYRKEYKKAEEYYLKAIAIDENYVSPYNGLGSVYRNLKKYEEAKKYYSKAIEIDEKISSPHYNMGLVYFYNTVDYQKAKFYFKRYTELKQNKIDVFYERAIARLEDIEKFQKSTSYEQLNKVVENIKSVLKFSGKHITHYTSITTVQFLVLKESPLRISEGSFLNDTSEGKVLYDYLDFNSKIIEKNKAIDFLKRPFIGSFVEEKKCDDLTLWRMYGKEELEEAKGCSITINAEQFKEAINPKSQDTMSQTNEIEFYKVAYRNGNKFEFAGATAKESKKLNDLMKELKNVIAEFNTKKEKTKTEDYDVLELLNEITYLFKSVEYQYENEVRLVISETLGFDITIDFTEEGFSPSKYPQRVFIELAPVNNLLKAITIGPKVEKAEEWASTFYYHLQSKGFEPLVQISTLPFK